MTRIQKLIFTVVIVFFCTGFDQMTKDIARERLASAAPISLLSDTIRIQYIENTGGFLGLGANLPEGVRFALFVLLHGLITTLALVYALKLPDLHSMQLTGLLFIASGGLGNLIDRLFNDGAAIDFLNLGIGSLRTGIFNVADVFIVAGGCIFMLVSLRDHKKASTAKTMPGHD